MTRLEGTQATAGGAQVLYGNFEFSIGQGTSADVGGDSAANRWAGSCGGFFYSYSVSPDLSWASRRPGEFSAWRSSTTTTGLADTTCRRERCSGSVLPTIAFARPRNCRWASGSTPCTGCCRTRWRSTRSAARTATKLDSHKWGVGANVGVLYEPSRSTRFGLTWNSQVKLDFAADGVFPGSPRTWRRCWPPAGCQHDARHGRQCPAGLERRLPPSGRRPMGAARQCGLAAVVEVRPGRGRRQFE